MTGWKPILHCAYAPRATRENGIALSTTAPPPKHSMYDRLPACLRLPSVTSRPPTSFAAHRISRQQGLIGPTTGWKPIVHRPAS